MKRLTLCMIAAASLCSTLHAQTASDLYQRAVMVERTAGRLDSAIALYQRVVRMAGPDRALAARALFSIGRAYETLGRTEARASYERLLRDYGDQKDLAAQARTRIAALGPSAPQNGAANSAAMIRRLSRAPQDFGRGTVSPNGNYVSYTDPETGNLGIHNLTTGVGRRLTGGGGYALSSAISPDGLNVAYVWYTGAFAGTRRYELRVMPVLGGASHTVALVGIPNLELCGWSPDGKSVVAIVQGDTTDRGALALIDIQNATVRRLRNVAFSAGLGASVSRDGKWIAYAVPTNDELGGNPSIRVIAADGSRDHALVEGPSENWRPLWTPDGRGIVFESNRIGSGGLWFLEVVDGDARAEPVVLVSDMRGEVLLGFARDGRLFYTPTLREEMSVTVLDRRSGAALGEPRNVAKRFNGSDVDPDLSRDGRLLTFRSNRGPGNGTTPGTSTLVIVELDTGDRREFTPRLVRFFFPRWSSDGRSILLVGRGLDEINGFYQLDAVTGALHTLATSPLIEVTAAEWSADGRSIFYQRRDGGNAGGASLWRYDLDDSTHRAVYAPDSLVTVRAITPSLEGQWLGFLATYRGSAGASAVRSVALSLSTHRVSTLDGGSGNLSLTALVGGDFLGFRYRAADSVGELWRVPAGGGASNKLAYEMRAKRLGWPRIAADASRIAFPVASDDPNGGGIWTIENFLPAPKKPK